MLVQVTCDARTGDLALVHAYVEPVTLAYSRKNSHGLLGHGCNFGNLSRSCQVVGRNVAIRTNQEMPRVVWKQVEQNKAKLSPMHNQRFFVAVGWSEAERALVLSWLLTVLNVDQSVWGPEVLKRIRHSRHFG